MGLFDFIFGKKPAESTRTGRIGSPSASALSPAALDWRNSEPHRFLLSRFLRGQELEHAAPPYWEPVLGEPPKAAIDRFIADGLLIPAPLEVKLDRAYKVTDLKPLLKERGLPVSGKKDVLIERLVAADPTGMAGKVASLRIVECSPTARPIAERYVAEKQAEKTAAVEQSLALLRAKEFGKASMAVGRYEAKQVFPRGLGIDWSRHDPATDVYLLEDMFTAYPGILAGLPTDEWDALRTAAAMMHLWGTNGAMEWLPEGFAGVPRFDGNTAARMLLFHATYLRDLRQYREMGVKRVTIHGCGDASCDACRALAGKIMPLELAPELPYAACTHDIGCRCRMAAAFDR